MKNANAIKLTRQDIVFETVSYILLTVLMLAVLYPLYFVLIASFSDPQMVNSGQVLFIPKGIMLDGYQKVLSYGQLWVGYRNTILYTVLGTILNVFLTMLTAYPLSKKFYGRNLFLLFVMIPMYLSGGLIPTYLIMQDLGLVDNWLIMVVSGMVSITNIIICRTFLVTSIPNELYEAAFIDGLDHFGMFTKIVLPLSKPILAVMCLYYGVAHWNDFWTAMIYINNSQYYPLQLVLRGILTLNQIDPNMFADAEDAVKLQNTADLMKYAMIIVSTIPLLVVYPFIQKYFTKGVMLGSLKG